MALLALVVGACSTASPTATAQPSPSPTAAPTSGPTPTPAPSASASPSPSATAAGLLLKVTSEGGFINPTASLAALPQVVVDSDGHIYTPGFASDGSNPLVQPVDMRDVGTAGAQQILDAIKAAGLDKQEPGSGPVADAGTSVFTVMIDGEKIVNRFGNSLPGPGHPGGNPGGSPAASADPAQAAYDLLARLTDPTETWGATSADATTYAPLGYRVYVAPATDAGMPTVAWPLSTSLANFGAPVSGEYGVDGLRSGVVIGADAVTLGQALAAAQAGSELSSGGANYEVWIRALLPDEIS
jgi:hypothetical protein